MADYGHELRFGIFVPPEAARGRALLRLVRHADESGLEVLAVQDHPYQPAFLDAWTLLSYLAAVTRNLTLMPAVANLPLRPPAVLARSAASLDLLSAGRVELGLGAGAFWDAIEAMGGTRRTPGQALAALREAIGVLRALWGEGERSHLPGEFYPLRGAKPVPPPAHSIGIWLGVYGPRALGLTGELADGWLGSSAYAPPDRLPTLMSAIDTGARAAGRVPALIRRAYVIDPTMTPAQLTELALSHGISEFLLPVDPDGEAATHHFATEAVPAVRAAVAAARAGH
ncbi:LLM class flavin-dependent oxidoreductase [Nocardia seriolae]|uniref:LLM class flavin-dependent oxidoreductase n=1 Tax=Nocardia seriolae TaxID=37332 RepID=UPI00051A74AF|nr:LLM class flavin-dependent oxidoreductase [Nocardia seriolae]MTJ60795.1 LLM class flavin-dependent oxidoreductase [Nocardia seriolae]MTJ70268.1 LLM class flavin-dependent oxidoreductase [Nocardia seriolae]MTJ91062.1 LLM class flavin-dependent oxidoreductase [Nocardia seriolae]MTK35024.1 LLM class flavin-dependent oxidoreductase [Nocardia seriolae]MTK38782.1 LLM class flavin-dependent oxidoreductase [Nocardia seriolae]